MSEFLSISESAMAKLQALFAEANQPDLKLRLFVAGGGCSGLQFGFQLDKTLNEDDTVIDLSTPFAVIADPISIQYLEGADINYTEEKNAEGRFSITNSNISTGCPGCSGH